MLTIEQAINQIIDTVRPVCGQQQVAIREALGRVLAHPIDAPLNVPASTCSAMDGYAIHHSALTQGHAAQLRIVGEAFAGHPFIAEVAPEQCVRIFTGAVLPSGTDTVLMQEQVTVNGQCLHFDATQHTAQQFINRVGSDVAVGRLIFAQGRRLTPADIGLLASLGIAEVRVMRRLRVAFFSTGDELCPIEAIPKPGQIYDSNRYTLFAMLQRLGVEIADFGVVPDVPADIERCLLQAAQDHDVVISSGGVSVGEADYVAETLRRVGEMAFWKIAMKPGKPLTFGKIEQAIFFGLPGNPVAVMGTFYQCVKPALRCMMGEQLTRTPRFRVPCLTALSKQPGRLEFQRGILTPTADGIWGVQSTGQQNSNMLSSMSQANCFIVLAADCTHVAVGEWVEVEPFEGLI